MLNYQRMCLCAHPNSESHLTWGVSLRVVAPVILVKGSSRTVGLMIRGRGFTSEPCLESWRLEALTAGGWKMMFHQKWMEICRRFQCDFLFEFSCCGIHHKPANCELSCAHGNIWIHMVLENALWRLFTNSHQSVTWCQDLMYLILPYQEKKRKQERCECIMKLTGFHLSVPEKVGKSFRPEAFFTENHWKPPRNWWYTSSTHRWYTMIYQFKPHNSSWRPNENST